MSLTAKDIMRRDVTTIAPSVTIRESIDLLLEKQISGLPVVDEQGELVGMITEFALLGAAYDEEIKCDPVSKHMTRNVLSIESSTRLRTIADKFIVHRIRRVPVIEDGKLVGQISRRDVLRAVQGEQSEKQSVANVV